VIGFGSPHMRVAQHHHSRRRFVSALWWSCTGHLRVRRVPHVPVYQPEHGRHLRLV